MLKKGAPTLFSSIEGKLLNFNLVLWLATSIWFYGWHRLSSLKLQKSTVKLQFGFIVSNVSPLFHLASDNKGSKLPEKL